MDTQNEQAGFLSLVVDEIDAPVAEPVTGAVTTKVVGSVLPDTDPTTGPQYVTCTRDDFQAIIEEQRVLGARYAIDSIIIGTLNVALDTVAHCGRTPNAGRPCVADAFTADVLLDSADHMVAQFYGTDANVKSGALADEFNADVRVLRSYTHDEAPLTTERVLPLHDMLYLTEEGEDNGRRGALDAASKAVRLTLTEWRVEVIRRSLQRSHTRKQARPDEVSFLDTFADMRDEQTALAMASGVAENYRQFLTLMIGDEALGQVIARVGAEKFEALVQAVDAENAKVVGASESSDEEFEAAAQQSVITIESDPVLSATFNALDVLVKASFRTGTLPEPTAEQAQAQDLDAVLASIEGADFGR